jgi:hypothetical protein
MLNDGRGELKFVSGDIDEAVIQNDSAETSAVSCR